MTATHEYRVSTLAHRIGLQLARLTDDDGARLYRLVEPTSMTPICPGGNAWGTTLDEIEDWLGFPWE
jgi:hypothetical protein